MKTSPKLGVIGCGNMGGAIVRGVVNKGIISPSRILLHDVVREKVVDLAKGTGARYCELSQILEVKDILLIAIKPQDFDELSRVLRDRIGTQTIVSIMAGLTIKKITEKIGDKKIPVVRAMPNVAALIGEGMTCICRNAFVKKYEKVKNIFSAVGKVLEVDETFMDSVTALSGSGPAYLFYLAEAMMDTACELGFSERKAKELVVQTLYGASLVLRKEKSSPTELIEKVASKGGTTRAALSIFEEKDFQGLVKLAIKKAKARSKELAERM